MNPAQSKISVFLIIKNEAKNLPQALSSIENFAEEIIIVDDYSTDDGVKIAQTFGAKIFTKKLESFTAQKQYALEQCSCKWALNIDADEILTPKLKDEILNTLKNTNAALFFIPFTNIFLGKKMKYSGLNNEKHPRLALRSKAFYSGGLVHETLKANGKIVILKNFIEHRPYNSIAQYFEKFNKYTSLGAQTLYKQSKKFKIYNLLRPPIDFFKIYVLKLAFLDGLQGFLWALFSSFYPAVKYAKLWELQRNKGRQ
ncbi:MAG: glycosyltransferase family 2 protein [Elusimicrobiota bacterium]|jgi:glycosyltransferase involved in cell wall biosynthesis|nr:glycosyltransferase family 2 protein [Elusimicrobiota bacterium]